MIARAFKAESNVHKNSKSARYGTPSLTAAELLIAGFWLAPGRVYRARGVLLNHHNKSRSETRRCD